MEQFNILSADPAGEPWQTSHGMMLQTYFVKLDGYPDQLAMVNRKVGNSMPTGVVWAEVKKGVTSKGRSKWNLTLKPAPDNAPSPGAYSKAVQTQLAIEPPKDTVTWGQALVAASTWLTTQPEVAKGGIPALLHTANDIYHLKPLMAPEIAKKLEDEVVKDLPNEPINFDEIPF